MENISSQLGRAQAQIDSLDGAKMRMIEELTQQEQMLNKKVLDLTQAMKANEAAIQTSRNGFAQNEIKIAQSKNRLKALIAQQNALKAADSP